MPFLVFSFFLYVISLTFLGYIIFAFFHFEGWDNPPYIPSFGQTKRTLLAEVEKFLKKSAKPLNVADLGCGDGSLLAGLSPKWPGHHFYGYEWDLFPFSIAKGRLKKYKNTQIIRADLMKSDLSHLDIVFFYLAHVPKLGNRLKMVLKPSAIVLSEVFEIDGWIPCRVVSSRFLGFKSKIFIYQVRDQKFHRC